MFRPALLTRLHYACCFAAIAAIGSLAPHALHAADQQAGCTPLRGLIVLVEFPGTVRKTDKAFVEDRFFVRLDRYVRQMSYDRFCIGGEMTDRWYTLPNPITRYSISSRNLDVDRSRLRLLVNDVFEAVEPDYDPAAYDFVAFVLAAEQREYGMIGLAAYPGMLGWHESRVLRSRTGRPVRGVAIFSYQAHIGTLFHDVAHIIGGVKPDGNRAVPCLYDHDLQARPGALRETFVAALINMGFWDPMSAHYYKPNIPPPGLSSWTRIRLGWLPDRQIATVLPGETREIVLGPLQDRDPPTLAIRIPLTPTTYYLVENRQPIGADTSLPGHGVLIMRADEAVAESRHGRAPVKLVDADPSVPHLEGAAFDIGKRDRYADRAAGVTIEIVEKLGSAYRVRVSRAPDGSGARR